MLKIPEQADLDPVSYARADSHVTQGTLLRQPSDSARQTNRALTIKSGSGEADKSEEQEEVPANYEDPDALHSEEIDYYAEQQRKLKEYWAEQQAGYKAGEEPKNRRQKTQISALEKERISKQKSVKI